MEVTCDGRSAREGVRFENVGHVTCKQGQDVNRNAAASCRTVECRGFQIARCVRRIRLARQSSCRVPHTPRRVYGSSDGSLDSSDSPTDSPGSPDSSASGRSVITNFEARLVQITSALCLGYILYLSWALRFSRQHCKVGLPSIVRERKIPRSSEFCKEVAFSSGFSSLELGLN